MSLDGYGAGPRQTLEDPLGVGGETLHEWLHHQFDDEGTGADKDPVDASYFAEMTKDIGAVIMGRNMFGPVRGDWPDEEWKGWWGDDPPYHTDVFVLTHHARPSVPMAGGTTFHFVTGGISEATERARAAAGDRDVLVAGGASTVQQFLRAELIESMHVAFSPVLLGGGERLFAFDDATTTTTTTTRRAAELPLHRLRGFAVRDARPVRARLRAAVHRPGPRLRFSSSTARRSTGTISGDVHRLPLTPTERGEPMGHSTTYLGHVEIVPGLNQAEYDYLRAFAYSRRCYRPDGPYAVRRRIRTRVRASGTPTCTTPMPTDNPATGATGGRASTGAAWSTTGWRSSTTAEPGCST